MFILWSFANIFIIVESSITKRRETPQEQMEVKEFR